MGTFLVIYSGIRRNTISRCSGPLSHFVSGFERLPTRLKLPMISPYVVLDIFVSFNSIVTFATFPDAIDQIVNLAEVRSSGITTLYF